MDHSAYAQILDHKKTARKGNALMVAQATRVSKCAEGLGTSTFSTLMHTKPQLMIGAVETLLKTSITRNGMLTWIIVD